MQYHILTQVLVLSSSDLSSLLSQSTAADCTASLSLVDGQTLDEDRTFAIRKRHQPRSTSQAVRKLGRLTTIMEGGSRSTNSAASSSTSSVAPNGLTLREALLKRLANLVPEAKLSTAGIDRRVRHTGTFTRDDVTLSETRKRNKATIRQVAATVWKFCLIVLFSFTDYQLHPQKLIRIRERVFAPLKVINEYLHTANVTSLNPLRPGHFIIALHPQNGGIIFGEGSCFISFHSIMLCPDPFF